MVYFGVLEAVVAEAQRHGAAEVLDRGDLLEDLLEAGAVGDVVADLRPWPRRRGPASARCRAASRSSRSAGRADPEPRAVRESSRRRDGGCTVSCGGHGAWTWCARQPRRVLPRACSDFWAAPHPTGQVRRGAPAGDPPGTTGGMATRRLIGDARRVRRQRKEIAYPTEGSGPSSPVKPVRTRADGPPPERATRTGWPHAASRHGCRRRIGEPRRVRTARSQVGDANGRARTGGPDPPVRGSARGASRRTVT